MKKLSVIISFLICVSAAGAIQLSGLYSPRAQAMGGALTGEIDSADIAFFNPAALPRFSGYELVAGYGVSYAQVVEGGINSLYAAVSAVPLAGKFGGFGVYYFNNGNSIYSESQVGVSYGYKIIDLISAGITLHMNSVAVAAPENNSALLDPVVKDGANASSLDVNAALSLKLNDSLSFGVNAQNLLPQTGDITISGLTPAFTGGFSLKFKKLAFLTSSRFNTDITIQDSVVYPKFGLEGTLLGGLLALRAGYQAGSNFCLGASARLAAGAIKRITVNYTFVSYYRAADMAHKFGVSLWI